MKPTIAAAVRDKLNKVTEWFKPAAKSGRKKKKRAAPNPSKGADTTAPAAEGTASTAQPGGAPPKKRHKHTNWATTENQEKLRQVLSDWEAKTGACSTTMSMTRYCTVVGIPLSTFSRYAAKRQEVGAHAGRPSNISDDQQRLVADVLIRRDRANDGVGRQGGAALVQQLAPLEFDMQFNNDARVYTGTITKVKQLRNKTVYVCEYDDGDSVQHTEEELRVALRGE